MLKHIGIRVFVLLVLLIGLNFLYVQFLYEKDLQQHSSIINEVRAVNDTIQIVYFGESSNFTFKDIDVDKRSISDFIADFYPDKQLKAINKEATHAGIYKILIENIPTESDIETLIVTLNLRSFNADWIYSKLETPLQKSVVLLRNNPPLLNRFLLSFKGYDIKTDKERLAQVLKRWEKDKLNFPYSFPYDNVIDWDKSVANHEWKTIKENPDQAFVDLAAHYVKTYAFQIDTNSNPRIKDFDRIVEIARKRGWNLVFNLLAENTEKAKEMVGDDLVYLMKQNRDLLVDRYRKKGVIVVDNLETIPSDQYIDQNWTTEHYDEAGRKTIAANVAMALKVIYPNDYSEVVYKAQIQTEFFHDCEKSETWGEMHTISDEKSFSGKHSSKTGNGKEYSIAFLRNLNTIPDSLKSSMDIQLWFNQSTIEHDAVVVITVLGDSIKDQWSGISLLDYSKEVNSWQKFEYSYSFNEEAKKGDLIKVFLYNPTNKIIFIDDIKISFK